jgi:hypothetical protein
MTTASPLQALTTATADQHAVWGGCRLEWGGIELFGTEAIADLFRHSPLSGDSFKQFGGRSFAIIANAESALLGEILDAVIVRLWRTGGTLAAPGEPGAPAPQSEQSIVVAFDTDLLQQRGDIFFSADDHAELHSDAADFVRDHARAAAQDAESAGFFRPRTFVTRAHGDAAQGAALFNLQGLSAGAVRKPIFARVILIWMDGKHWTVSDAPCPHGSVERLLI